MIQLYSPAKINLFLRIVKKRSDGYHEISSLFQAIDLLDVLTFEKTDQDLLTCTDPSIPTDGSNLVMKALHLFRQKSGLDLSLKIHLNKKIPAAAGLGGGSSNAATTLWACNQLTGRTIGIEKLQEWGSEIGSDIPFFFSHGTAYCYGRGEKVEDLTPLPPQKLCIVKPLGGCSTPAIYGRFKLTHPHEPTVIAKELTHFLNGSLPHFNDLELPAFEVRPDLKVLKHNLIDLGFETVVMSGSGSSFFCLGEGQKPTDLQLKIHPAQFIHRTSGEWYIPLDV